MSDETPSKIRKAPSVVTWRAFTPEDLGVRSRRECSTPGCKEKAWSLRTTTITRSTGGTLVRKHAFCEDHTPDGVV